MREVKIKTKEPIKITLLIGEYNPDTTIEITYKKQTYVYAYINHDLPMMYLDLDAVKYWIEETYYDLSFLSPQYVPCELKASNFKGESK